MTKPKKRKTKIKRDRKVGKPGEDTNTRVVSDKLLFSVYIYIYDMCEVLCVCVCVECIRWAGQALPRKAE